MQGQCLSICCRALLQEAGPEVKAGFDSFLWQTLVFLPHAFQILLLPALLTSRRLVLSFRASAYPPVAWLGQGTK